MSNPNNELTKKQRGSQDDEPSNTHAKSDSIEPMNIMNLCDDFLDQILKKLNHVDLLNVADTNKRLREAADKAFKSKYRKHLVKMDRFGASNETRISINGFVHFLKVIRCFGRSISKLELSNENKLSKRQCVMLDCYIKRYGVPSVTELDVYRRIYLTEEPRLTINMFTFLSDINKYMPNLRALRLEFCDSIECIAKAIPNLEHLSVFDKFYIDSKMLGIGLLLNPQLKSLEINGVCSIGLELLRIASILQLKSLVMNDNRNYFDTNTEALPIQFKSVTELETDGRFMQEWCSSKVSISFDHLEELKIQCAPNPTYVIRFLSKHSSIARFIHIGELFDNEMFREMAKVLPSVTEVISRWYLSVDAAIDFLNECKLLKKLVFRMAERSEYDSLRNLLGKKWRSSIEDTSRRVTLEC